MMSGGGGDGENTVGRAVHTLKARPEGVCVCVCVWLLVRWQDVRWQNPPSDTTTVGPLWISSAPPLLSCSTTCLPSSLLSSTRMVCVPYPTFFSLLLPLIFYCEPLIYFPSSLNLILHEFQKLEL